MNDFERWLAANDQYLANALISLRERLERLARADQPVEPPAEEPTPAARPEPARRRSLVERLFRSAPKPNAPKMLPPAAPDTSGHEGAPGDTPPPSPTDAETQERPPALVLLAQRLGLSEFERQVLLLCAAMELDTRIPGLCARAQQDAARPFPTFALAMALFDEPTWDALSPERPLRYWRLIEINQQSAQPLIGSALRIDERIVNYLKGLNYLDERLSHLVSRVPPADEMPLPPSQAAVAEAIQRYVDGARQNGQPPVFQLLGADGVSKLIIARHAAAGLGVTLYRLPAEALPVQSGDHENFVRLWQRESALLPIALYVDTTSIERGTNPQASATQRMVMRGMGAIFLDTRGPWPDLSADSLSLDVGKPTSAEQHAAWSTALAETAGDQPARLAGQFNFNIPTILRIAAAAQTPSASDTSTLASRLWTSCLRHARPALDQLAQPLEAKATWDDLALPAAENSVLRLIVAQASHRMRVYDDWAFRRRMNRGLGITVLFAGESGTGKTTAAEVIANELGLQLYRIDLSAVVSKYIGETEKNLRRLFDAAEEGGAILFFDEADALFGKRSEVKDSHDRYANIEINYLLQRMETYRGLAILATNMKAALDSAFLRRLRFVVNFPFPGPAERGAMWQKVFPAQTPVTDVDFQRLAKLNLTGGSIHNIALSSAFLAAQADTSVTMPLILEAARYEFRKIEKPISEADFHWLGSSQGSA